MDKQLETTADQRAEERLTRLRSARRERIRAGKSDAFDCSSEDDIVCPHCGAWTSPEESVLNSSNRPEGTWRQCMCQICLQPFQLKVTVRYSFTTVKGDARCQRSESSRTEDTNHQVPPI